MTRAIIITGPQGSGKTTFGKFLAEALGVPFADTSTAVIEALAVYFHSVASYGRTVEFMTDRLADEKENYRPDLAAMGDALCHNDPTALIRKAMTDQPLTVIAGVRRIEALQAARDAGLVECAIWIERPDHEPQADNLTITAGDCDLTASNGGDLELLAETAETCKKLYLRCKSEKGAKNE